VDPRAGPNGSGSERIGASAWASGESGVNRKAIVTFAAPPPAGTYSQAIRSDGPLVFISGQTPRTLDGKRLVGVPFEQQARLALDNLEAITRAVGLSLRDAVKVDVFLWDLKDRAAFDAIYANYIGETPPARTLVQSNFNEFDVEVSAVLLDQGAMHAPC
jgi:2-iminobutanoate/2-iminopropanoate deaminase